MADLNQNKKGLYGGAYVHDGGLGATVDSQALQDIIDVLKHPFQTSCNTCNGMGFIRSGKVCQTCEGSGKVQDDLFTS
jgi:DnaJ-class molecular chaperone